MDLSPAPFDTAEVLAAFDAQVRRAALLDVPGVTVEDDGFTVRVSSAEDGWNAVTWSGLAGLSGTQVDAEIAQQVGAFGRAGLAWEWKHYSHDLPVDLPVRLVAAGLVREPEEALMVARVADLDLDVAPPAGVKIATVESAEQVGELVAVHDEVFGGDHAFVGQAVLAGLGAAPRTVEGVVARADGRAVSAGRVELHHGTQFASIWGGGTVLGWRGRGVFRALVAHRARVAAEHGFTYLQVDALPTSRPILERLGFHQLATTTPFAAPGR